MFCFPIQSKCAFPCLTNLPTPPSSPQNRGDNILEALAWIYCNSSQRISSISKSKKQKGDSCAGGPQTVWDPGNLLKLNLVHVKWEENRHCAKTMHCKTLVIIIIQYQSDLRKRFVHRRIIFVFQRKFIAILLSGVMFFLTSLSSSLEYP